jgi:tellurite resistance protein TerC
MLLLWTLFLILVVGLLALDLGVFNRKVHVIGFREALRWTFVWIAVALLFGGLVYAIYENHWFGAGLVPDRDGPLDGSSAALKYLNGYLLEKCLSVDNLFVIAMIMASFKVPAKYQHRVLFWGILGAIVTRGIFIGLGAALVSEFGWIFYVFGALLLWTGGKMLFSSEKEEKDPHDSWIFRAVSRVFPIVEGDFGGRFTTRVGGALRFTSLLPAVVIIEATDVMFAVDSVPAIFGITSDAFIVFTSNIFAILGLRSLFFVLADSLDRFHHLKTAVAIIILFIAIKMILHDWYHIPVLVSLAVIDVALVGGIVASLSSDRPAHTSVPPDHPND